MDVVEIRIGIVDSAKEISLEVDDKPEALIKKVEAAVNEEVGLLWITDRRGKQVGIPAKRFAYMEIDPESVSRSVGFTP